jgi:hypothetical protein
MRILILTHPRSGGLSLLNYIQKELDYLHYKHYHEPFFGNGNGLTNEQIDTELLVNDNIIVKDFPFRIKERGYNLQDLISKFDKVIIHHRGSHRDMAISLTYFYLNDGSKIHLPYEMTDEWIKNNENHIQQMMKDTEEMYNDVQNISYDNCIRTSYDGIYMEPMLNGVVNDKCDIPKLLRFLNIYNPLYLDILDKRHRLQNGDIGMNNIKIKPKLI